MNSDKRMNKISIDLHLHFDGSLSVSNVRALAALEGIDLPESDAELCSLLTVAPDCKDLGEYLTKFSFPLSLLQSAGAIELGMRTLCDELVTQNCIYAEIRFAPQLHTERGLKQSEVVEAAIKGFGASSLRGGLILCCMRGEDNRTANEETVRVAEQYLGEGVLALDLAGNEARYPNGNFVSLFDMARQKGIPFTIHAGEAASAESVLSAIEMGACRIGHGVRAYESIDAMRVLADTNIPLELCPTSNLQTAIFKCISEYPIKVFMDGGICVTVNSDNRSVSATTACKELDLICESFGFDRNVECQLLQNSVKSAFADEEMKRELLGLIAESYM